MILYKQSNIGNCNDFIFAWTNNHKRFLREKSGEKWTFRIDKYYTRLSYAEIGIELTDDFVCWMKMKQ